MTRVKICGIRGLHEARQAHHYGAWAMGQVFAPSRRRIEVETAARINRLMENRMVKVGVFVNEKPENIHDIARECRLDLIQLHGDESPGYVEEIKYPVIKAIAVRDDFDPAILQKYRCWAFLFDTHDPHLRGGTGRAFDWNRLAALNKGWRIILAGGIDARNVDRAIRTVRPMALDLSSSLEYSGGGKDPVKIKAFMEKVKEADRYVS